MAVPERSRSIVEGSAVNFGGGVWGKLFVFFAFFAVKFWGAVFGATFSCVLRFLRFNSRGGVGQIPYSYVLQFQE